MAGTQALERAQHDDGDGDGCNGGGDGGGIGVEDGVEGLEDRIRESLESTRRAWRYVVEVEAAAQLLMFGSDGTD